MSSDAGRQFGFSEHLDAQDKRSPNYNRWIADQFTPYVGDHVLEVGCGIGTLSEHWIDRASFVGIDTEAECVAMCSARFADHPDTRFLHDRVGAPDWVARWTQLRPDTIVAINVLEHIREDLEALRGWQHILRARGGGRICVFVPAFEFAYSDFDHRYGHYRRYTKETLRDKALDAGLEVEKLRYFNMPGLLAWWSTFVLLRTKGSASAQVGLYDRVVVPLVRRVEKAFPPPFGNSVVAVFRA
jgi:SAM-dependent methyltransferase